MWLAVNTQSPKGRQRADYGGGVRATTQVGGWGPQIDYERDVNRPPIGVRLASVDSQPQEPDARPILPVRHR
jgi:hypothetical protein